MRSRDQNNDIDMPEVRTYLALEVIKAVTSGRIKPHTRGCTIEYRGGYYLEYDCALTVKELRQLQKIKRLKATAAGALYACLALDLYPEDLVDSPYWTLRRCFSERQLDAIQVFFNGREDIWEETFEKLDLVPESIDVWVRRWPKAGERLCAIMSNIIRYNGRFQAHDLEIEIVKPK